jgi:two-component system sensor histidine kinase KdpD
VSVQADDANVVIRICDEGPGIAPEESERIFEKFHRSDAADHRAAGTGLGLAVARGFTEALGGALTAENRTGHKGATFVFTFPIAAEQAAHDVA